MNDLNQWEKVLRSWTPRRPSADLKEKLFPAADVAAPVLPTPKLRWLWYAPAAAGIFLAAAFLSTGTSRQVICMIASAASNQPAVAGQFDLPALPAGSGGQQNNVWSVATFDWTKATSCLSTTGSFPAWKTNTQKL
jgi:hypothetical protein